MKVQARAKINLALDVVKRMDNGYHSLDMIMVPISIYDEIEIEKNDEEKIINLPLILIIVFYLVYMIFFELH